MAPARRRFAEGTRTQGEHRGPDTLRRKLETCLEAGSVDEAIEAYLALAQTLIEEHRLGAAADALSTAAKSIAERVRTRRDAGVCS